MLEEAEIEAEKKESDGKSRSITINAVYETPNPNLLKDCHIEGRIWVLMWLEEILEFGLEITRADVRAESKTNGQRLRHKRGKIKGMYSMHTIDVNNNRVLCNYLTGDRR